MEERKPETEIADEDLERVSGGQSSAGPAFGAGAAPLPGGGGEVGISSIIKSSSDTQGGIVGNLK